MICGGVFTDSGYYNEPVCYAGTSRGQKLFVLVFPEKKILCGTNFPTTTVVWTI